jgi:hypothetical protein
MPSPKKDPPTDAPKPRAVRKSDDTRIADTAKPAKSDVAARAGSRTPPPNARVVQPSYKTGTVSRAAVRAAVKRLSSRT